MNGVLRSLASGFGHGVHRSVGVVISEDGGTMVEYNAAGATAAYWCSSRAHLEHPPSPAGGRRLFLVSGLAASQRRHVMPGTGGVGYSSRRANALGSGFIPRARAHPLR